MKNVVFFIETEWAFGQIHYALCKQLLPWGINAEVLDWFKQYSNEEFACINNSTDLFVTTPVGVEWLMNYGVPIEKIAAVGHGQWDILLSGTKIGYPAYEKLAGYGVVSEYLKNKSIEFGVSRVPSVLTMGVHFDKFYSPVNKPLTIIGYAGAWTSCNFYGIEIKRGRLVYEISKVTGLPLLRHEKYHYLAMPMYYKQVDAVVMTSMEEAAGLPMMEAACAGKLTLGTPVGYYETNGIKSGGVVLPIEENKLIETASETLNALKCDPIKFIKTCEEIQEFARHNYDWRYHLTNWANFLWKSVLSV